jgi:hypothetical protein
MGSRGKAGAGEARRSRQHLGAKSCRTKHRLEALLALLVVPLESPHRATGDVLATSGRSRATIGRTLAWCAGRDSHHSTSCGRNVRTTQGLGVRPAAPSTPLHGSQTPPYLMTSSANTRRCGGSVIPRAWAVLRLMTSSNFVGCSTGRSAGCAPFRILSMKTAVR